MVLFPVVVLMFLVLNITYSTYQSLKGQMFLLRDFNSSKYSVAMDKIDDITPDLPNITVTTIPMKSIKARYYFNAKKYEKAIELLDEGIPANPYLFFSENLKAQIYLKQNNIDSAFINAKAFFGLPKNALHASTFAQTLAVKKDVIETKKALRFYQKIWSSNMEKLFNCCLNLYKVEKDL